MKHTPFTLSLLMTISPVMMHAMEEQIPFALGSLIAQVNADAFTSKTSLDMNPDNLRTLANACTANENAQEEKIKPLLNTYARGVLNTVLQANKEFFNNSGWNLNATEAANNARIIWPHFKKSTPLLIAYNKGINVPVNTSLTIPMKMEQIDTQLPENTTGLYCAHGNFTDGKIQFGTLPKIETIHMYERLRQASTYSN